MFIAIGLAFGYKNKPQWYIQDYSTRIFCPV